jgi:2-polyprenyl-3-methyl-5-hydroxy-6-metoxy-1,4-benzoquinol methylase
MKCPVCLDPTTAPALTGADRFFQTTPRTFHLSRCVACYSLFLDPLPELAEIAGFYPAAYWWKSSSSVLKKLEMLYRRTVLRDHLTFIVKVAANVRSSPRPLRILDVGCGSGTLLGLLKKHGFDVLGLDYSREAAAIASIENNVEVVVGSLEEAHFEDASFDLVTLFHVMEHVTNPRQVLAEVRRILKPNGRLVIQVPNIESWQFKLLGEKWYGLDIPRHVIDYSNKSMHQLLNHAGFSVHRVRHFNLRDNAQALASSLFPSLDPVSRTVRKGRRAVEESPVGASLRHFVYLAVVVVVSPFALAEAAAGSGATIMIEGAKG